MQATVRDEAATETPELSSDLPETVSPKPMAWFASALEGTVSVALIYGIGINSLNVSLLFYMLWGCISELKNRKEAEHD